MYTCESSLKPDNLYFRPREQVLAATHRAAAVTDVPCRARRRGRRRRVRRRRVRPWTRDVALAARNKPVYVVPLGKGIVVGGAAEPSNR